MQRLYAVAGWGIVALGALHMSATRFDALTTSALWFFSGGIALALTGALNLLNRTYGRVAPGLRWVCIGTNVVTTLFSVVLGIVDGAWPAHFVLVLGLLGGATVLSLTPTALLERHLP